MMAIYIFDKFTRQITLPMDAIALLATYYRPNSKSYQILYDHSCAVRDKALEIATNHPELMPDLIFIEEAAMIHDIGIFLTNAPGIYCFGDHPYICHGYLGKELVEKMGFPDHALVCERHTGIGITKEEVKMNNLPLPVRDFVPESVEEQIICFADKFFSKGKGIHREKEMSEVRDSIARFNHQHLIQFNEWCKLFL